MPVEAGSEPTGQEVVQEGIAEEALMGDVAYEEVKPTEPAAEETEGKPQTGEAQQESQEGGTRDPATGRFVAQKDTGETDGQPQTGDPAAASPQTEAQASPQEPQEYPEWTFQADGRPLSIPGSKLGEQGIFIPTEQSQWLAQQLATASAHNGSWQRELQTAKAEGYAALQQAQAREAAANEIVQNIQALAEGDEDAAWEWFQNYRSNLPRLLANAERSQLQAERDTMQHGQQLQAQQQQIQQIYQQQQTALNTICQGYAGQEEFKGVDAQKIRDRLESLRGSIFYAAPTDDPAGTYRRGDILVNYGVIEQEFQTHADYLRQVGAVGQAAAGNQAALAGGNAPPVAAGGTVVPAQTGMPKMPKFKTEAEMNEYLESQAADKWADQALGQLK